MNLDICVHCVLLNYPHSEGEEIPALLLDCIYPAPNFSFISENKNHVYK